MEIYLEVGLRGGMEVRMSDEEYIYFDGSGKAHELKPVKGPQIELRLGVRVKCNQGEGEIIWVNIGSVKIRRDDSSIFWTSWYDETLETANSSTEG